MGTKRLGPRVSYGEEACTCGDVFHEEFPQCDECGYCPLCCGVFDECEARPKDAAGEAAWKG